MDLLLSGMHIAILVTDGFEQSEFIEPKEALEREGAITKVISERPGMVQAFFHDSKEDKFTVEQTFDEADAKDFDAILLPGGVMNADRIRLLPKAQRFVRDIEEDDKPIAVICHGSWLLVSAGLVKGRTLTSWPTLQDDIRNAGGKWVNQEVVVDRNWISSRKPADIPAFNKQVIEQFSAYKYSHLKGTADEDAVGIASS